MRKCNDNGKISKHRISYKNRYIITSVSHTCTHVHLGRYILTGVSHTCTHVHLGRYILTGVSHTYTSVDILY